MFAILKKSGGIIPMLILGLLTGWTLFAPRLHAEESRTAPRQVIVGPKIRVGGRFDNVRMCVATPAGTKGGPAADISLSTEFTLKDKVSLEVDLPVFRPILFGLAFDMLQFEPSLTLKFRRVGRGATDFVVGPTIGISLHYGPDYNSERSGAGRTDSFFALGPVIGGYIGLDFKRPNKKLNLQLGLTPYVTPLFSVNDDQDHRGVVVGGLLDLQLRFGKPME